MPRTARSLLRPLGRWGLLAATLGVVGALLVASLTAGTLFAAHHALEATPELPRPTVDVASLDDLDAAVRRSRSTASVLVDRNGTVFARFKPEETHIPLEAGDVPPLVEVVLTAAEDQRFRDHAGYDPGAILRAFARNASQGGVEQGGSTITQQLAKMLFTGDDPSLERKIEEVQVAVDLEERFDKDEILAAYANVVFLGEGAYGFEAAAREYFRKSASEMDLAETALLVGVLPSPSNRNPRQHPEAALEAYVGVLADVAAAHPERRAEAEAAMAAPPTVHPASPLFEAYPYYADYVRRFLLDGMRVDPDLLYGGGLTIETALDPALQSAAQAAVAGHLPPGGPEAALAVVEVRTGLVPAIVGGRAFGDAQVNLALGRAGGGSGRQAGSSFKPFALAAAFEQGMSLDQRISAPREYLPASVPDPKPVSNFTGRAHGSPTLRDATIASVNTAYVQLTEHVGATTVRDVATRLGVEGLPAQVGPSIGLGAYETSPLAMARAYAGLAHDGLQVPSSPVRRLLAPDGSVVADFTPPPEATWPRAVSVDTARAVTHVLEENIGRGTATRARLDRPAAAKTGTANDFTDAWLVGHTPSFATAVWLGHVESNRPMQGVAGFDRVTGGSIPSLIWRDVMLAAHAGVPPEPFAPPPPPRPAFPGALRGAGLPIP